MPSLSQAEDISFCATLYIHRRINCYVASQPAADVEMWGDTLHATGDHLGTR